MRALGYRLAGGRGCRRLRALGYRLAGGRGCRRLRTLGCRLASGHGSCQVRVPRPLLLGMQWRLGVKNLRSLVGFQRISLQRRWLRFPPAAPAASSSLERRQPRLLPSSGASRVLPPQAAPAASSPSSGASRALTPQILKTWKGRNRGNRRTAERSSQSRGRRRRRHAKPCALGSNRRNG